jgi:hypothetical protein
MSLEIDGFWKSGFWTTTFWADGFWREGAAVVVVVDTHDGEDERDRDHKRKRDKLREQIRLAIDGPDAPVEAEDDPVVQQIIRPVIRTPERLGLDDYMRIHARLLARFDEIENSLREEEDEILLLH